VLRTIALYPLPAALIATGWMRLEEGAQDGRAFGLVLLALLPALVRPWWARAAASVVAVAVAARVTLGISPLDARPFSGRDFFGPLAERLERGTLRFYDVPQPFSAPEHPLMHDVVLVAVFGFCLAVALAIAARRPLVASVVLVVGSIWPATLVAGADLARGGVTLAVVLGLLAAGGEQAARALRPALAAAGVLVVASLALSTSPAVAKRELVDWRQWDLYDEPARPVSVRYVWDANYDGIRFPPRKTVVLEIEAPRNARYWRATTLDTFVGDRWIERLDRVHEEDGKVTLLDPTFPRRAEDGENWTRADVSVEALDDERLVAGTMPVAFDSRDAGTVDYFTGNVAVAEEPLEPGADYTTWTFVPQPTPEQLGRAAPGARAQPLLMRRYLEIAPRRPAPAFRERGREARLRRMLRNPELARYRPLYRAAQRVVRGTRNQYAAVVALEAWFRAEGDFLYDEQPPLSPVTPPLVDFVTRTQRGYCQQFAGAMTLMLRYLGIPARVGAGFTTGTYDGEKGRWTVTDHDAHTWVEVWFPGFGWLPFDPTPSRGGLSGAYTTASRDFDARGAAPIIGAGIFGGRDFASRLAREFAREEGANLDARDRPGDFAPLPAVSTRPDASLLRLLALGGAALVAGLSLVKLAVRRARRLTRDARRRAAAYRRELVEFLVDQGFAVPRSATIGELGALVERELRVDPRRFVRAANTSRFAPPERAHEAVREAGRELRRLQRQIRRRVGLRGRLRGALSLRSLSA
jgi:transglutaminase-like putative cysteine protease